MARLLLCFKLTTLIYLFFVISLDLITILLELTGLLLVTGDSTFY